MLRGPEDANPCRPTQGVPRKHPSASKGRTSPCLDIPSYPFPARSSSRDETHYGVSTRPVSLRCVCVCDAELVSTTYVTHIPGVDLPILKAQEHVLDLGACHQCLSYANRLSTGGGKFCAWHASRGFQKMRLARSSRPPSGRRGLSPRPSASHARPKEWLCLPKDFSVDVARKHCRRWTSRTS